MLAGNKGEWSEIYVFFKLLAEGRLHAANANLEIIEHIYYPIVKILRENSKEYVVENKKAQIKIIDGDNKDNNLTIPVSEFVRYSEKLFRHLKEATGRSFPLQDIQEFLDELQISTLSSRSQDKADIKIVVHDLRVQTHAKLGFSIKSMLGGKATLFNAGQGTNFIYEVIGDGSLNIENLNASVKPKILNIIKELQANKFDLRFHDITSGTFRRNLEMIDSNLPRILSELLLIKYATKGSLSLSELLEQINTLNPLNYDLSEGHPFYYYKIKKFLTDVAVGMTPQTVWSGVYDATGGIIIVKQDGELVCYHIYNRNEFENYLLNNTRFDQASTGRYEFGELYEENGRIFIKLNMQIRFTN